MYPALTKAQLAARLPCSAGTMSRYLRAIEHKIPHYRRQQRLLTPDQVRVICEHYCIEV